MCLVMMGLSNMLARRGFQVTRSEIRDGRAGAVARSPFRVWRGPEIGARSEISKDAAARARTLTCLALHPLG